MLSTDRPDSCSSFLAAGPIRSLRWRAGASCCAESCSPGGCLSPDSAAACTPLGQQLVCTTCKVGKNSAVFQPVSTPLHTARQGLWLGMVPQVGSGGHSPSD